MSGFSSVIGFMLSFFIIIVIFSSSFFLYNQGIIEQNKLINNVEKTSYFNSANYGYEIYEPYYSSGRLNFYLKNTGNKKMDYLINNKNCFDFFFDSEYINKNNFKITPQKHIPANYSIINSNEIGLLTVKKNELKDSTVKSISCEGIEKIHSLEIDKIDWWDNNWNKRKIIEIQNNLNQNLNEYQVEINLNSTNFDFSSDNENNFRVIIPLKELTVLDLTFDNYKQKLDEYSNNNLDVFLGEDNLISNNDPSEISGVIFNGLNFNGSQFLKIPKNKVLEIENTITYSAWINWNNNSTEPIQNIISNGNNANSLQIINDHGINHQKISFNLNISGTHITIHSNTPINNKWNHLTAIYNGNEMKLYINNILVANQSIQGKIITNFEDNFIGSSNNTNYFNGDIDEVKIFNTHLTENEITNLYHNNLRFREIDFYISSWDNDKKIAKVFGKIPTISANSNLSLHLYYDNKEEIKSTSNIESTFSYIFPQTIGYVVNDLISSTNGLSIYSLTNNNTIYVGNNQFNLSEQESDTLLNINTNQYDKIKAKSLVQIEGNGNTDDIIVPISFAGTAFYYRGFRSNQDTFCMLSPYGDSNVQILNNGALAWSGVINNTGNCITYDIPTNNNLAIHSTIPILVSYRGGTTNDAFVFYPATNSDLFGVPSNTGYIASGPDGVSGSIILSDGSSSTLSLGSYSSTNIGSGTHGTAPGHKITTNNLIGVIQQADADGTESSVFVPQSEMSTKFGSGLSTEYITLVSPFYDANCSTYNNAGNLIDNIHYGVGSNGVYKYDYDTGNSNSYLINGFKIECDKPVWGYFEEDIDGDETNMLGYLQMRQFVYPPPSIIFK